MPFSYVGKSMNDDELVMNDKITLVFPEDEEGDDYGYDYDEDEGDELIAWLESRQSEEDIPFEKRNVDREPTYPEDDVPYECYGD